MTTIVIPGTGVVLTGDATAQEIALAWEELADHESQIRSTKREISDLIIARLDHEGRRSMQVDGVRFEASAPTEKVWDLVALQGVLDELVTEGTISHGKSIACIKWEPKAVWSELRTLLSDPRCKARLELCVTEQEANRYAKVKRAR